MVGMAAFLGVLFVAPLFFQIALGLSALQSGLNTFPEAIGVMVGAQLASRLFYPRFGPRRLVACGLVGVAVVMTLMTQIGFTTDLWWMRVLMFAMGLTMSQVFVSCQAAAFATISLPDTGSASSIFNSGRQLGSAMGVAVLATVLAAVGTNASTCRPHGAQSGRLPRRLPHRCGHRPGGCGHRPDHQGRRCRQHHGSQGLHQGPGPVPFDGRGLPRECRC